MISENELRTYIMCSKLYSFDKEYSLNINQKHLEYVLQGVISTSLRDGSLDSSFRYVKLFAQAEKYLNLENPEVRKNTLFNTAKSLYDIFQYPTISGMFPVMSGISGNKAISKTNINFKINGMYSNGKSATTVLCFSPFTDYHSIANDYINDLKIEFAENYLIKDTFYRHRIKYLFVGLSEKNTTIIVEKDRKSDTSELDHYIKSLENQIHYPISPCGRVCKYKNICKRN